MAPWLAKIRNGWAIARRARDVGELKRALADPETLERRVLNRAGLIVEASGAADVASSLGRLAKRLKAAAISDDGRRVDYSALRGGALMDEITGVAARLRAVRPEDLPDDAARTAFWINVYNVLVLHGIVALGIEKSVMEVPSFFAVVAYDVGGHVFTLDDMEHGMLRRNGPHPATGRRRLAEGDPRWAYAVERPDARVHFALVCAARGCPPISFYAAEHIEAQLDLAARAFVAGDVVADGARIVLSSLFQFYADDFGGEHGLRRLLVEHAGDGQREALARAEKERHRFRFRPYDWDLNGH